MFIRLTAQIFSCAGSRLFRFIVFFLIDVQSTEMFGAIFILWEKENDKTPEEFFNLTPKKPQFYLGVLFTSKRILTLETHKMPVIQLVPWWFACIKM